MQINWKIIVPIVVLVLAAVAYASGMFGGSRTGNDAALETPVNDTTVGSASVSTPPAPLGNVSTVVDALLADAAAESASVSSNDASALVDADSQAINNLGQYNAYDF